MKKNVKLLFIFFPILISIIQCSPPKTNELNVIIISIDALRSDHISGYGYSRQTTPNIDAFLKKSTIFTEAVTTYPKTAASMASMLTGLYPYHHGVRKNAGDKLSKSTNTLPQLLKDYGYTTAAFVSNVVLRAKLCGYNKGFDLYDDTLTSKELNRDFFERKSDDMFAATSSWLKKNKDKKFFLWTHFIDPHGPYTPPAPYDTLFKSTDKKPVDMNLIPAYQRLGNNNDANSYIDLYDGEIAYMDYNVGQLLKTIDDLGLKNKTIIIFTADHGESLGEHNDYFEHGRRVYESCVRIPLAVNFPGIIPEGRKVNSHVQIIDIFPTILDMLNIRKADEIDGKSLLPVIRENKPVREYAFLESFNQYKPPTVPKNIAFYKAIRTPDWKFTVSIDKSGKIVNEELFNLKNDPAETKNIAKENNNEKTTMRKEYDKMIDSQKKNLLERMLLLFGFGKEKKETVKSIEKNDIKALKSLGYVQ